MFRWISWNFIHRMSSHFVSRNPSNPRLRKESKESKESEENEVNEKNEWNDWNEAERFRCGTRTVNSVNSVNSVNCDWLQPGTGGTGGTWASDASTQDAQRICWKAVPWQIPMLKTRLRHSPKCGKILSDELIEVIELRLAAGAQSFGGCRGMPWVCLWKVSKYSTDALMSCQARVPRRRRQGSGEMTVTRWHAGPWWLKQFPIPHMIRTFGWHHDPFYCFSPFQIHFSTISAPVVTGGIFQVSSFTVKKPRDLHRKPAEASLLTCRVARSGACGSAFHSASIMFCFPSCSWEFGKVVIFFPAYMHKYIHTYINTYIHAYIHTIP
jgi:hypothetical protein